MLKALLCKLNFQHDWHVEHTEDGTLYSAASVVAKTMTAEAAGLARQGLGQVRLGWRNAASLQV